MTERVTIPFLGHDDASDIKYFGLVSGGLLATFIYTDFADTDICGPKTANSVEAIIEWNTERCRCK